LVRAELDQAAGPVVRVRAADLGDGIPADDVERRTTL
jgi:hypothetical protein